MRTYSKILRLPDDVDAEHNEDVAVDGVPPVLYVVVLLDRHVGAVPGPGVVAEQVVDLVVGAHVSSLCAGSTLCIYLYQFILYWIYCEVENSNYKNKGNKIFHIQF